MTNSPSQSISKTSQIFKKESKNKFIGNIRSKMTSSISKKSQFSKKEWKNNMTSLSQPSDKVSETDKKISQAVLIENIHNTYQWCNKDLNKFELLLRKGVYPYENMDTWKRFKKESLPDKESFYSELNKEHITDKDYAHAQKVWKEFNIKNLGEYHDLYVQCDTTLLADVFENFRDKCIEIYELDLAHFLSAPGLSWWACLKKTEVQLELLTDNDMLLMIEEGIRGGMCNAIQ